jgi:hypothetical protein
VSRLVITPFEQTAAQQQRTKLVALNAAMEDLAGVLPQNQFAETGEFIMVMHGSLPSFSTTCFRPTPSRNGLPARLATLKPKDFYRAATEPSPHREQNSQLMPLAETILL